MDLEEEAVTENITCKTFEKIQRPRFKVTGKITERRY